MKTRQEFIQAEEAEQQLFISKLLHAIRRSDIFFNAADSIIQAASAVGVYDNIKFGVEEVYGEETN